MTRKVEGVRQEERFLVHEGTLRVREGFRRRRLVRAGEEVAIRARRPHTFEIVGESAHFTAEFRPAWQNAEVFRDVFALSAEGRLDQRGNPSPSDVAVLLDRYPEDFFYSAFLPIGLQRLIARALVTRIARTG